MPKTFNVTDSVAPTVKLTNLIAKNETVLTNTVPTSTDGTDGTAITIFRGAKLVLPLKFSDNASEGRVNVQYVSGLPKGVSFGGSNNKLTFTGANETNPTTHTVEGKVAADATLGYSTVTLKVSDSKDGDASKGNSSEVKFRVRVLDLDFEPGRVAEPNQSSTTINATKGQTLEDANNYLTVNSGTNRQDQNNFPGGMTFRMVDSTTNTVISKLPDAPGRYVVKARAYFPVDYAGTNEVSEVVTGNSDKQLNGRRYLEKTINFVVKPTAPTVTPKDNGDVLITPTNQTNVDKVSVTFTKQDDSTEVTYTAKKNASGVWEFGSGAPLTVDPTTGVFRLKDRVVKDGSTVTAKALTTDGTGSVESIPATGIAGNGDAILPEIEFKNTVIDAQGNRVVYITPTETTNLDVATITDNSNKLLEAVFFDQGAGITDLGNYGLTYNKVIRNGDTITNAPLTFTVRGTLNKIKSGSTTLWNDDDVITTRYASAMDAAENNIKEKSGSRDNVASNPYRVIFKALTQATKYTPTVSKTKIERDITQANTTITVAEFNKIKDTLTFSSTRGEVKVDKNTSGLTFAMKNSTVQTKQDGTLYITATVTYPDGSREDIEVPLDTTNANKAKPTLTIPEVSVKAAKDKGEQGSVPATEYNRVLNNVTVPQTQPQPTAKEVKNNGRISVVDGKNVVTVGLTFSDNTKKDVTVPVLEVKPIDITTTFNELDNMVTVKPNTTVENGDKLHVTIRGVGMQLTKTAAGYTNSRNDRDITVNSDGSITINLLRNETFQAGDRIVTRHESNKNGKVDSYETEAFAGLKPVEKVPVLEVTALTNKEKEDVKAAVKKANPSVNTAELEVAANGDVTYRHKGAGVGTSDPTPEIRLNGNVIKKPLDFTVGTPAEAKEKAEYTSAVVVTPNKPNSTITSQPVNGLRVDETGKVVGTPEISNWGDEEEERNVTISVTVSHDGDTPVTKNVVVKVLRDTDGDGTPDKTDNDDDGDGIDDNQDSTPKVKTALIVEPHNPTTPVVEGQSYTNTDVVVTANKPGVIISSTPSHGLSVNDKGQITGIPSFTKEEWGTDEEKTVTIPVTVSHDGDTPVTVNVEVKVQISSKKGEPEVQPELPEFNGGVNGELPDPVELPKVKLIITKWVDEKGNELKPADAKAPTVLGEANEALEAGEIEGYVFVRTEVKDDVVTHIFRKVTPSKPEGNGEEHGEGNKPQPTAKVEKATKRLANTGEAETNTGLAGLGLAMLGSLLAVAKRRREDEE